jgi:hypothetical protein
VGRPLQTSATNATRLPPAVTASVIRCQSASLQRATSWYVSPKWPISQLRRGAPPSAA